MSVVGDRGVEIDDDEADRIGVEEDSDGGCPAGYELEIEHGQAFCQPHGGDDPV